MIILTNLLKTDNMKKILLISMVLFFIASLSMSGQEQKTKVVKSEPQKTKTQAVSNTGTTNVKQENTRPASNTKQTNSQPASNTKQANTQPPNNTKPPVSAGESVQPTTKTETRTSTSSGKQENTRTGTEQKPSAISGESGKSTTGQPAAEQKPATTTETKSGTSGSGTRTGLERNSNGAKTTSRPSGAPEKQSTVNPAQEQGTKVTESNDPTKK
jgi:hypothetical protein